MKRDQATVVLTDRAWPDDSIERTVIEAAGHTIVSGPGEAGLPAAVEALIATHQPAAIMACWAPITAGAIRSSTQLRVVARMGVGLDNIAVDAATARGILVTNVPDYCVEEVSDHAVAMTLAWTRGIVTADRAVRAGRWSPADARLRRLATLTCGIVGYGRIGSQTARKLAALGARVVVNSPHARSEGAIQAVTLDELLATSDVVVIHAPLTEQTHHLIGARELSLMRPDALLVNVSRGGLVDTTALTIALGSGQIGGASLDVLEEEPTVPQALLAVSSVTVTPHIAFSSDIAVEQLRRSAAEEVVRVLSGQPARNPCNLVAATAASGAGA